MIGKKSALEKLPDFSLKVGDDAISPTDSARNIGAILDSNCSMSEHIATIARGAWFHIHQIGRIRCYLDLESTKILVHSFVSSRLDNFNSLLHGVPKCEIKKLQRIQNSAARMILGLKKYDHVTPALISLHWLPVALRIDFKILVLVYKSLHGLAPTYLCDLVCVKKKNTDMELRSDAWITLIVPKRKNASFGKRAFSYIGPFLWNQLPIDCKQSTSLDVFKRRVKTHLFKVAYDL